MQFSVDNSNFAWRTSLVGVLVLTLIFSDAFLTGSPASAQSCTPPTIGFDGVHTGNGYALYVGEFFSYQITSTGTGPVTYAITEGGLHPGLTLTATGFIYGTPTAVASVKLLKIKATNACGSDTGLFPFSVNTAGSAPGYCALRVVPDQINPSLPSTLIWDVDNGTRSKPTTATISPQVLGANFLFDGEIKIPSVQQDATYTLTIWNSYGSVSCSATAKPYDGSLLAEKKLFEFRWDDHPDVGFRVIYTAAVVKGELIMVGGGAGGYKAIYGEGIWSVRLSDGKINVREMSLDGGSKFRCPMHHGSIDSWVSTSPDGLAVSLRTYGNGDCTEQFPSPGHGDAGPRGIISYVAPLQKVGLISTLLPPLDTEIGTVADLAVVGKYLVIHPERFNSGSKIYTFPGLKFVADTIGVVPLGAVGDFVIGYDAADVLPYGEDSHGILQYSAYKVAGDALEKIADIPGLARTKNQAGVGVGDRPMAFVRDSLDPNRAVIQGGNGKLFSLRATSGGVKMTEIGMGPSKTQHTPNYGEFTSIAGNLIGVGGEHLVFGGMVGSQDYDTFMVWKGTAEIARGKLPMSRPFWRSKVPSIPNPPGVGLFYNGKLIMVGAHGAYLYNINAGSGGGGGGGGGGEGDDHAYLPSEGKSSTYFYGALRGLQDIVSRIRGNICQSSPSLPMCNREVNG